MNNYNYFINKYDLKVNKVTKKGNITIISTPLDQFVFKEADIKIYNYLLSRGFDYFPRIIDYNIDTIMFCFIENIDYDIDQKLLDYIKLLSLMHAKTCYFKHVSTNDNREIYDSVFNKIKEANDYYNSLILSIESKEYMSPCEYLVARNISGIFYIIKYCFELLDEWYKEIEDNNKKRVVTLYNNIDINNMLKDKNGLYFTNFNNTFIDNPIYDLSHFYNKYFMNIDIDTILEKYEKNFKLSKDEKLLLYVLISIPEKINIDNKVESIFKVKDIINKINFSIKFLNSKKEEETSTHQDEDNK